MSDLKSCLRNSKVRKTKAKTRFRRKPENEGQKVVSKNRVRPSGKPNSRAEEEVHSPGVGEGLKHRGLPEGLRIDDEEEVGVDDGS